MASLGNSAKYKMNVYTDLLKHFQKMEEERTFTESFCEATITLIPKPDKDITKQKKLQANNTEEYRCKKPQQNSSKQTP